MSVKWNLTNAEVTCVLDKLVQLESVIDYRLLYNARAPSSNFAGSLHVGSPLYRELKLYRFHWVTLTGLEQVSGPEEVILDRVVWQLCALQTVNRGGAAAHPLRRQVDSFKADLYRVVET